MKSMMMRSPLRRDEITEVTLTYHPSLQWGPMHHPSWRQQTCLALSLWREEYDALLSGFAFSHFPLFFLLFSQTGMCLGCCVISQWLTLLSPTFVPPLSLSLPLSLPLPLSLSLLLFWINWYSNGGLSYQLWLGWWSTFWR